MRVYVELPDGWGPGQVILTAWQQAGYRVDEVRSLATGERQMTVRGSGAQPTHAVPDLQDRAYPP